MRDINIIRKELKSIRDCVVAVLPTKGKEDFAYIKIFEILLQLSEHIEDLDNRLDEVEIG